jgi:hypothetical protein
MNVLKVLGELKQLLDLTKMLDGHRQNCEQGEQVLRAAINDMTLKRPKEALRRVAEAMHELKQCMRDAAAIIQEENAAVAAHLTEAIFNEAELDRVWRERQAKASQQPEKPRPTANVAYVVRFTSTTS